MKSMILTLMLAGAPAFAAGGVSLTPECKAKVNQEALKLENAFLAGQGQKLASELTAVTYLNGRMDGEDLTVSVSVEEEVDGRFVRYTSKVTKDDALQCKNIALVRNDDSACRYSRHEGPDSLNEIEGVEFVAGKNIQPEHRLNATQEAQIRYFLDDFETKAPIADLIRGTDDQYLSTGTVTLPGGKVLDYYGAYGGDNPYGIFFVKGTTEGAGSNGDGSICIK